MFASGEYTIQTALVAICVGMIATPTDAAPKKYEGGVTDKDVTLSVMTALTVDEGTPEHLIDVRAKDGVVMLTGYVHSLRAAERAERVARTVRGVRSVVSRITVQVADRSDEQLEREVREALHDDPATQDDEVQVQVGDGIVTLSGTVPSWARKRLYADVVRGVRGVRALDNELVVHQPQQRKDDEIAVSVRRRLQSDVWVRDGLIDVKVADGTVHLTGVAGCAAEKTRAARLAHVVGVRSVDAAGLSVDPSVLPDMRRSRLPRELSDDSIRQAVTDALRYDPRVQTAEVQVDVEDHVVTLTGKVKSLKAKDSAAGDALNTLGVWRVKNFLQVRPTEPIPEDEELTRRAERALARDPDVDRGNVRVVVRNRKAYLSGTAYSHHEREMAVDAVSRVRGIAAVDAKGLTVYPDQTRRSDEEIADAVRDELWWSPFVDSDRLSVDVQDGMVTLKGTVSDVHERNLATTNAYEGGARVVVNRTKIAENP